jgi:hypothetical protein
MFLKGLREGLAPGVERSNSRFLPLRLHSEGVTFLSLLGKVVGTARKIQGFFASLRMTNRKVTASQGAE